MRTFKSIKASAHSRLPGWSMAAFLVGCASLHAAQPDLPFSMEQLSIGMPEAGAPLAVVGPYAVAKENPSNGPGLQVYRPRDLARFPASDTLPIVVWGNGGCRSDGRGSAAFLSTIASYGFLVVGSAPLPDNPGARITTVNLIRALDWAQAEASRAGSPLAGKIKSDAVAVMGNSCGGNLALEAARDPRVDTLGMWNSGVWISGEMRLADGTLLSATTKADLAYVHSPTLYINGDKIDPAMINAADDFMRLDRVPVFFGSRHGSGHGGSYSHANGGEFANIAVAWLRWQLKGDKDSGKMFTGRDCKLCTDPNWTTQKKGL
ncbi:MAG: alpha/beta hydrolase [Steroidobacteraceae bacterium]